MNTDDTIAAIATPIGVGGIGIIKISGPHATAVADSIFVARKPRARGPLPAHRLLLGSICDPATREIIDEVLLAFMPGPASYTREDVLEIHCHSGLVVLERILELVLHHSGVRLAEPGEFTRRAFMNGRLDLTQVEAVLDIITARTATALKKAAGQLGGSLHERITRFKQDLTAVLVHIESAIDFPEEDLELFPAAQIVERLSTVKKKMRKLLATYEEGRLLREGVRAVILGCPNVGKSSILNALVEEDRAIVCTIPGTTRDTIEESVSVRGIPVVLVDTAGLSTQSPADPVEAQGAERTRRQVARADVVLFVLDGSRPFSPDDMTVAQEFQKQRMIVVINKADLPQLLDTSSLPELLRDLPAVWVSAKYHKHIEALRDVLYEHISRNNEETCGAPVIINRLRHKNSVEKACRALERALVSMEQGISMEFIAVDIHEALAHLGELVGETTSEEILDHIFAEFCIGK
ncbi:MAG TPA: tRNA uridine-5-carboxymethylaminomethyl(34) synthesis GTPase MnmE [Thermodesulfobacteriota bacterium]|nr:tRNA uridine-5-carboxymethylaminomethyl(34) synthesis GTPase MnmE [Thermodesulfobacteriota bacterium]HNU71362.1 tRNA uridine-5-carboxymethylaminomethyl(34) synthesis GTPase MnmE [Thermodesulfobacteriota bacterium]